MSKFENNKSRYVLLVVTLLIGLVSFQNCDSTFYYEAPNNTSLSEDANGSALGLNSQFVNNSRDSGNINFFRDPSLASGVQHGWANTLPAALSQSC